MDDLHHNMRDAYQRPPGVSYVETESTPKPGDLHEWDKLVDGCLYIDRDDRDFAPYYYQLNGLGDWIGRDGSPGDDPTPCGLGYRSRRAEVLAFIGADAPLDAFCVAAREHARGTE